MPRYNLRLNVTADNIHQVRKALAAYDVSAHIEKVKLSPSRADRLGECEEMVNDAMSEVESLKDELQDWRDSIPENLSSGDKAEQLDSAIAELDEIYGGLDGVRWEVDFPGMF